MTIMRHYHLSGVPVAKARHRTVRCGPGVRTYDPKADEATTAKWVLKAQVHEAPLNGPLHVVVEFYFSSPKKGKRIYHVTKPDLDNCIKFILDVGNGIIWADDKQIVGLSAIKSYGDPRTEIVVEVVGEENA